LQQSIQADGPIDHEQSQSCGKQQTAEEDRCTHVLTLGDAMALLLAPELSKVTDDARR
jgi:hypothetical protein